MCARARWVRPGVPRSAVLWASMVWLACSPATQPVVTVEGGSGVFAPPPAPFVLTTDLQGRALRANRQDVDNASWSRLLGWPGLAGVEVLDLTRATVEVDGLAELVQSPAAPALRTLELRGVGLSEGQVEALTEVAPASVRVVGLAEGALSQAGLQRFIASPTWMGRLEALDLSDQPLTEPRATAAPHRMLVRWNLARAQGTAGLGDLLEHGWLDGVVELDLALWRVPAEEVAARLSELSSRAPGLRRLSWTGQADLAEGRSLGVPGARALAAVPWPALEVARLDLQELGDEGARALSEADWPRLRELDLAGNEIGPDGVGALLEAGWLSGLQRLDLRGNPLDVDSVRSLRERLGERVVLDSVR
jgi:hypothetical protein